MYVLIILKELKQSFTRVSQQFFAKCINEDMRVQRGHSDQEEQ